MVITGLVSAPRVIGAQKVGVKPTNAQAAITAVIQK
jgi:hypothetical protein